MNKTLMLFLLIASISFNTGALDVEVEELKSVDREVVFVNYQGPYDRIESAEEIKAIGRLLAGALERDERRGQYLLKYSVIRAVDPAEVGKFDADIISIDKQARVDHIDNVRRITAGYLEAAHGYSSEDARLLAVFATIYNAVFRGDLEYFSQKYKKLVLSHISKENAGISTRYFEWSGATRMLIPLTGAEKGKIDVMSTTELTEEAVIEEMRRQEDMGLEDRKEMVELKEREVEEKKEEVEQERESLEEERAALEEKKEELEKEDVSLEQREAVEEKEREIEKAEVELAEKEEDIRKKEEEIARERAQIIEDEISRDREEKAEEAEVVEAAAIFSDKLYYMKVRKRDSAGYVTSTLSVVDPISETLVVTSPVSYISGRNFHFFKQMVLVVAHERAESGPTHLLLLHPHTLERVDRSTDPVYRLSFVTFQSGFIYTVVESGGAFHLGKFDENLTLIARSSERVDKDSAIALFGRKLYINAPDGSIMVLEDGKLERVSSIQ